MIYLDRIFEYLVVQISFMRFYKENVGIIKVSPFEDILIKKVTDDVQKDWYKKLEIL